MHLVTLSFSATLGRFDDAPLQALQAANELLSLREHFFVVGDVPHLLCVLLCAGARAAVTEGAAESAATPTEALAPDEQALFERLRAWRTSTAHDEGVPPYVVLTNRQLRAVVQSRPTSVAALRRIDGIGEKKAQRHGAVLLTVLHGTPAATVESAGEAVAS